MKVPCRSCERREIDWGGCRCQAMALAGDAAAADPACLKSPLHHLMADAVQAASAAAEKPTLVYRRIAPVRTAAEV
jgi:pyrroloquinoline quinone biosynthesis protein E